MRNKYIFGVITGWAKDGNICMDIVDSEMIHRRTFEMGEVVILPKGDGIYGREVCGQQRKPSKWFINMEAYKNLDDAIEASRSITLGETPKSGFARLEQGN